MKRVIHGRADANFQDRYGNNPLSIALGKNVPRGDELDLIRHLLDVKADPYFIDGRSEGITPISWVFESGIHVHKKVEIADILLEYKVDVNAKDECGRTAIFRAIARNNRIMVNWLIKNGANLSIPGRYGVMPIDLARFCKQRYGSFVEIVKTIEEAIEETEVRDINGFRGVWGLFSDDEEDEDNDPFHFDWEGSDHSDEQSSDGS